LPRDACEGGGARCLCHCFAAGGQSSVELLDLLIFLRPNANERAQGVWHSGASVLLAMTCTVLGCAHAAPGALQPSHVRSIPCTKDGITAPAIDRVSLVCTVVGFNGVRLLSQQRQRPPRRAKGLWNARYWNEPHESYVQAGTLTLTKRGRRTHGGSRSDAGAAGVMEGTNHPPPIGARGPAIGKDGQAQAPLINIQHFTIARRQQRPGSAPPPLPPRMQPRATGSATCHGGTVHARGVTHVVALGCPQTAKQTALPLNPIWSCPSSPCFCHKTKTEGSRCSRHARRQAGARGSVGGRRVGWQVGGRSHVIRSAGRQA
jgi:hypothetical protein